jgi:hypothetical protein
MTTFYELPPSWQHYILDLEEDNRTLQQDLVEADEVICAHVREREKIKELEEEVEAFKTESRPALLAIIEDLRHPHLPKTYSKPPLMPGMTERT